MQHFTYKYWSTTQTKGGAIWQLKGATKRETLKSLSFFLLPQPEPPPPPSFIRFFPSSRQPRAWLFGLHTSLPFSATSSFPLQPAQLFPHFLSSPSQLFPSSSSLPQSSLIFPDQRTGRAVPHLLRPTAHASASRTFLPQPPNSLQRQQQPTDQPRQPLLFFIFCTPTAAASPTATDRSAAPSPSAPPAAHCTYPAISSPSAQNPPTGQPSPSQGQLQLPRMTAPPAGSATSRGKQTERKK